MYVRITKGVGWNKGMEGEIFRVLPPDESSKVTQFKGIYPVEHPDNTNQGVKVIKKHNCEIVEDDEVMKVSNETVLERLCQVTGTTLEELVSALKNLPGNIEVKKNETIEPLKLSERDLVVRNAKKFLEDLKCEGEQEGFSWEYRENRHGKGFFHSGSGAAYNAQFIVNAEKKTVVCLLRAYNYPENIMRRGIAKCMPEDCFNEHIGKAISLAKALKEEFTPTQFTNSPQPEGFKVGDIIEYTNIKDTTYRIESEEVNGSSKLTILTCHNESLIGNEALGGNYGAAKVIDDSSRYQS